MNSYIYKYIFILAILFPSVLFSRENIAIINFEGIGIDKQEAQAISVRLISEIMHLKVYQIVERSEMERLLEEQKFQYSGCVDINCAVDIGKIIGAKYMVVGSASKVGNFFSLDSRLISVESGELYISAQYSTQDGIEDLLLQGVNSIAHQLCETSQSNEEVIHSPIKKYLDIVQEPFSNEKSGKVYHIEVISEAPGIDGVLDDAIWSSILPITDFIQEEPDNMALPTENMEVYIAYDDKTLYIGAKLYDSNPDEISQKLSQRDDWYGAFDDQSDWFSINLDSRHDHQTAFSFSVNASGVMSDEMIYNDENYDTGWNAIWDADTKITDFGWVVEMGIPFSMLPFNNTYDLIWGLNITRFIQRKYETITWVGFPLEIEGIVSKFGHLTGLKGIFPPSKFEFSPYSLLGLTNYSDLKLIDVDDPLSHKVGYVVASNINFGLDMKYRITQNSLLTLAINPDFGQVESDPADINLTSYETYLTEKRTFFLKDSDIFETPIEIFYSRRIGENSWGLGMDEHRGDTLFYDIQIPVKINTAGKLTGKTKQGLSYGLLGAITTETDSSAWHTYYDPDSIFYPNNYHKKYFISRVKQDLFSGNSFFGLMTTSSVDDSSHIISVDGMINLIDNKLGIDGQVVMSSDNKMGVLGNLTYSPLGFFSTWMDYQKYELGFNLGHLGYLWRDNYSQLKTGIKFQNQEPWGVIRNSSIILEWEFEENSNNHDLGKTIELTYDAMFSNYWRVGGGYYKIQEHYDDRKIFSYHTMETFGPIIKIPEIFGYHFNISSDEHRNFSADLSWTFATNKRDDLEKRKFIEFNYHPNTSLTFSASYENYRLNKKYYWLEELEGDDGIQYIFSDFDKNLNIYSLRSSGNIGKKLSIQIYSEIYQNKDIYSNYSQYIDSSRTYKPLISEDIYTTDKTEVQSQASSLILDPNLYISLYPRFTSLIINGVLKWNYVQGSNVYIVYTARKSVNGETFSNLGKFFLFNSKKNWVETLRDQSIMVKIDYWFEK